MAEAKSVICTVFERDYHFGVGGLANSLYRRGFRGVLYAGYRGALPPWVQPQQADADGFLDFAVAPGFNIHFERLDLGEMLAYVKPELIRRAWDRYGERGIENVFYIDSDIIIKADWHHFEDWAENGVALCEDLNSPLHRSHPLRKQWSKFYASFGIQYEPQDDVYVNGGFVGLNRKYRDFNDLWDRIQDHMKEHTGHHDRIGIADRWNLFHFMDQDALNVAKDLTPEVSIMGRDAMDFGRAGYVMSHAAGRKKPWHKSYVKNVLKQGARPTHTDKAYWLHVEQPIRLFPHSKVRQKRFAMKTASLIGRFFTR